MKKQTLAVLAAALVAAGSAQAQSFSENFDGKSIADLAGLGWSFTGIPHTLGGDLQLPGTSTATYTFTVTTGGPQYNVSLYAARPTNLSNPNLDVVLTQTAGGSFTQALSFSPMAVTGVGGADPQGSFVSLLFGPSIGPGTYSLTFGNSGLLSTIVLDTLTITPVPEPATVAFLLAGGVVIGATAWRRRRHDTAEAANAA